MMISFWIFGRPDFYYCLTVIGSCNETRISFVIAMKQRKLCTCLLAKFGWIGLCVSNTWV